jgi:hexosaminidase
MPLLDLPNGWTPANTAVIPMAGQFLARNDELSDLLQANQVHVSFEKYNLDVFLSIARLFRQNLQMLLQMDRINQQLQQAATHAAHSEAVEAVATLDQALNLAARIRTERNDALQNATNVWYEQWFPRVPEANGRRFLDQVDDVKDHLPVRTVDMSYLVYRELLYPFEDWANRTLAVRNQYSEEHHLPARSFLLDWKNTEGSTR